MKLFIIFLTFLFFSFNVSAQLLTEQDHGELSTVKPTPNNVLCVGHWNVLNLNSFFSKDTNVIIDVIKQCDLWAISEVEKIMGMYEMKEVLKTKTGIDWGLVHTRFSVGEGAASEYVAFIYKKIKVDYVSESLFVAKDEPFVDVWVREPTCASFKSVGGKLTFMYCGMHLRPKTSPIQNLRDEIIGLDSLTEWLTRNGGDLLIAGDFNMSVNDKSWTGVKTRMTPLLDGNLKTSIGVSETMSQPYDNILISRDMNEDFAGYATADYFFVRYYKGLAIKEWKYITSDHVPVLAHFYIDKDTD